MLYSPMVFCFCDVMVECVRLWLAMQGCDLPTSGLSLVIGMIADTVLRNIVSDNSIVTPEHSGEF